MEAQEIIKTEETQAEVVEAAEIISMEDADIRTGILFEIEAAKAQSRLQAMRDAAQIFAGQMREKYKASEETYEMTDWITGFRQVKKE